MGNLVLGVLGTEYWVCGCKKHGGFGPTEKGASSDEKRGESFVIEWSICETFHPSSLPYRSLEYTQ